MNINEKIVVAMQERGLSQAELGRIANISGGKMSMVVNDQMEFSKYQLKAAQGLGLDLNWLYDPNAGLPVRLARDRGAVLTPAEQKVLILAHEVAMDDPDLIAARRKLMGLAPLPSG